MHVLVIPSWYSTIRSPGGGSFFRDQAHALAGAGYKVSVLTPKIWGVRDYRNGPLPEMNISTSENDGPIRVYRRNAVHRLPRMPYRDSRAYTNCGLKLYDTYAAVEGRPDIIHAHGALHGGVLAAAIAHRTDIPFLVTEHSSHYGQCKHRWWQKRLIGGVLRNTKACLAVSPSLADLMTIQYPKSAPPIDVVPNILTPVFEEAITKDDGAKHSPDKPQPFIFLCVGRISTEKNQHGLVRAFADAFGKRKDLSGSGSVELHFIGNGEGNPLLDFAKELGVGAHVKVLGPLVPTDVRQRMADAGCVVLASFVETFGVVMIEALAAGTPVIGTICGGPEDIITQDNGVLIPTGDPAALSTALRDMYANSRQYDRGKLRRDCLALYGRDVIVGSLVEIYNRLLANNDDEKQNRQSAP